MSFSIKITDNNTGEVLVDETEAKAIIGSVGCNSSVGAMCFVRCSPSCLYRTVSGTQAILTKIGEDHPELMVIAEIAEKMNKVKEILEERDDV